MIVLAFTREKAVLPNVTNVPKDNLRCNPCTGNVVNSIPSLGTKVASKPFSVPTYKTCASGFCFIISLYIVIAGYICPPVPPPEIMIRFINGVPLLATYEHNF